MTTDTTSHVDHAEIKMGQVLTIIISTIALLLQDPLPLMLLGVVFLLSGTVRVLSPFSMFYRWLIQPVGIMTSDYRLDNIQPHKFGQLVGALTIAISLMFMQLGYPMTGWGIVVVLIILTVISYAGWCIGCFMYYQLNRIGLGGFFKHAPTDKSKIMGMRPGKKQNQN
ncbi:MAG: DUF4395 domain-containing protein [Gammaproteobacteria bacterium]|nr:DUF4395 domain-containing protein [Gammaproteobacteria bacterium]